MNGETKFWHTIRPAISYIGHYDRIESGDTATGRPDLNICMHGTGIVWDIELKFFGRRGFKIRPSQHRWMKQRLLAGGNCAILLKVRDHTFLISGYETPDLKTNSSMDYYLMVSDMHWVNDIALGGLKEYLNGIDCKPHTDIGRDES